MTDYADLQELWDPSLRLPIAGTTYVVPAPDAEQGLRLQALYALGAAVALGGKASKVDQERLAIEDEDEQTLFMREALRTAYPQMIANNVPWPFIQRAAMTSWLHFTAGPDIAGHYWREGATGGGDQGKAPAPARRRTATRTGAAAASTSKSSASATGTTARKPRASTPKRKPAAKAKTSGSRSTTS